MIRLPVQAQHDEPDWGTSPKSLPFQWRRNLCEPLNMTNISLRQACGHQPGQIVQSILHLLCSDDSNAFTPWSCEGLNSLSSSCASLPLIPGRRSSSSPDCLPRPAGCTPLLLEQVSRQSLGCLAKPCTPRQHRAPSLGCPAVPGLNWKKMIGCGSFARVYLGAPSHPCPLLRTQLSIWALRTWTFRHPPSLGDLSSFALGHFCTGANGSQSILRHQGYCKVTLGGFDRRRLTWETGGSEGHVEPRMRGGVYRGPL